MRVSRAEAKARTREQLLASGQRLFEAHGFHAVTIEEIVEDAGYTRGAFYAHFADKAAMLWELIERSNDERFRALAGALEAAEVDEKLAVLQAWFDDQQGSWPLGRARVEVNSTIATDPEAKARVAQLFAREREIIALVLTSTADVLGVELPIAVDQLAAIGLAIGFGISEQHAVDPDAVPASLFAFAQTAMWMGAFAARDYGLNVNTDVGAPTTGEHA